MLVRLLFVLFLLLGLSRRINAQQNFFNVPSSEITEKHRFFFQEQFNFYKSSIVSNSTLCVGLSERAEIGVNFFGLTFLPSDGVFISNKAGSVPVFPSFGINFQYVFYSSGFYQFSAGTQILMPERVPELEYYCFINNRLDFGDTRLVAGLYNGNNNFFGKESRISGSAWIPGIQFGLEQNIFRNKVFFQLDYFSGKNALSNLIPGFAYRIQKRVILSAGWQIPANKLSSSSGLIFEFTLVPR